MLRKKLILVTVLLASLCSYGQESDVYIPIGVQESIYSEILKEKRTIYIHTPDNYLSSDQEYPLIILLDGFTHFKTTVGVVDFMSSQRTRNFQTPESVLVAISNNVNRDRERDFTWTKIEMVRENNTGQGRRFLRFIEEELLAYVEDHYRVSGDRTLIGHSLGGLFAVNTYLSSSNTFQLHIAIDPSIWWDEQLMLQKVDSVSINSNEKKLFIATANVGPEREDRNKGKHEKLMQLISERLEDGSTLGIHYYADEDHRSVPLKAIYDGLKFVNAK